MHQLRQFLTSSIGRKILMSLTGLALIGFLVAHLAGNLLLFAGPSAFNHYSHSLTSNPLIYGAEIVLLALFVSHLASGILLTIRNRAARPQPYQAQAGAGHPSRKSLASATMILSGLVFLVFVPLHILTFKFGPHYEKDGERNLFRLVGEVFQKPGWVVWYVVALAVIGSHLWHGFGSSFETLGVRYRKPLHLLLRLVAVALAGGFLVIPILVYLNVGVKL